jgi:hypothetical protein
MVSMCGGAYAIDSDAVGSDQTGPLDSGQDGGDLYGRDVLVGTYGVTQEVVQGGEVSGRDCQEQIGRAGGGGGETDLGVAAELFAGLLKTAGGDVDPQECLGADTQPGEIDFGCKPDELATD